MPEPIKCPDCGHVNPAGSTSCSACNFPLDFSTEPASPPSPTAAEPGAHGSDAPPAGQPITESGAEPMLLPPRPRRRPRRGSNEALSLWLLFGSIAAATVVFIGVKANYDRASQPVEGSNREQQENADRLRAALEKDSTNVEARVALANILYDTANWPEAIVHYRSAIRQDSSRVHAIVDLGVCYYNLGDSKLAQDLFLLALKRDPHQPVALFNLGIVAERRKDLQEALRYYHLALESSPPEEMKQPLIEAMQRVQQATGKVAPPLPEGR